MTIRHHLVSIVTAASVLACTVLVARPAVAQTVTTDNVTLINQDRALAGIGGNDAAGFPVLIARNGTYRLTSNLVVPAGMDGIQVSDGVNAVIDLNGFNIVGPAVCTSTTFCTANPGTMGVVVLGDAAHATVMNGRIRGFSRAGIGFPGFVWMGTVTADNLRLERNGNGLVMENLFGTRLTLADNSGFGLFAQHGQISDAHAQRNGGTGIDVRNGGVRNSRADQNGQTGFYAGARTVLQGNSAEYNKQGAASGGVIVPGSNAF